MTRLETLAGAVLLLLLVSTAEGSVVFTFTNPTGDTSGTGPTISSVVATVDSTDLAFIVNFVNAIAPPSQFDADNSVIGYINIDTTLTATAPELLASPFGGTLDPTKVQYFVDLQSEAFNPGFVNLVDTATDETADTLPISYTTKSFSVAVPLSDLGNSNGQVNFGISVGNVSEMTSQLVGSTAKTGVIPEPSSLVVWSLMLAGCTVLAVRRRRAC